MDSIDLFNFQIFYPYTTPTKIIKARERTQRKEERERDILKLKEYKRLTIVNERRYHKNMFK